jgi:hypothetical protein
MSRLLKRSELAWIKGVGHMPNLESEEEFNEAREGCCSAAQAASLIESHRLGPGLSLDR